MSTRGVAYIDALGMSQALLAGNARAAQAKLELLVSVTIDHLESATFVKGSNFSDTIALHTDDKENIWELCQITRNIFRDYWHLNTKYDVSDPAQAFLVRGGIAVGDITEVDIVRDNFRAFYGIGEGLVQAYGISNSGKGHRLFLHKEARALLGRCNSPGNSDGDHFRLRKNHDASTGSIAFREIVWCAEPVESSPDFHRAQKLFRRALILWKKEEISSDVLWHYAETFRLFVSCVTNVDTLIKLLNYRIKARIYHQFLHPIWADAWSNLFAKDRWPDLPLHWDKIWNSYHEISQTRFAVEVFQTLSFYNRLKPLMRFLKHRDAARKRL